MKKRKNHGLYKRANFKIFVEYVERCTFKGVFPAWNGGLRNGA